MIEFIIGDIVEIEEDFTIIQNNNMGYKVFSSSNSLRKLEIGKKRSNDLYSIKCKRRWAFFIWICI